ncbi:MAG: DUF4349 domain-containing protein [Spirochaetia bacterium]|nr:DUF4349 domain-containing protein [Spirochaetia bacterium]
MRFKMPPIGLLFRIFLISIFLTAPFLSASEIFKEKLTFYISSSIAVSNPQKSGDEITAFCESGGGYYTRKSDYMVSLRYPLPYKEKMEEIVRKRGTVLSWNVNTQDKSTEYAVLVNQLKSRKNLLSEYMRLIESSGFSGTLSLEKELINLVTEMEQLKGRIRKMENDFTYIQLDLDFVSEESSRPEKQISSFSWINRIDFYDFMGGAYNGE